MTRTREVSWPMTTYIYALIDPRSQAVRWVGKADNPERRLRAHLCARGVTPREVWIRELASCGLRPTLKILAIVRMDDWKTAEAWWIATMREKGCALLNINAGGAGGDTRVHGAPEARRKMSDAQRTSSVAEAARIRSGAARRGIPKSPEHRQKISAALVGREVTAEARRKQSEAMRGRVTGPMADDVKAKVAASNRRTKRVATRERDHLILQRRAEGVHPTVIAPEAGCCLATVFAVIKREGV